MFAKIVAGFFWDAYDNLGKIILANLIWFLLNIPGFFGILFLLSLKGAGLSMMVWMIFPLGWIGITTIGLFHMSYLLVEQKDISIWEYFTGIKKYGLKSILYTFLILGVILLLILNIQFYLGFKGSMQLVGIIISGLSLWTIVFIGLLMQYIFPLMVRRNPPLRKLLYQVSLLVLANLWMTILIALSSLGLLILTVITGIGPLFLTGSFVTLFTSNALYEILAQYDEPPKPILKPGEKPTSWHQIRGQEKKKWRHEGRGWKDILRPWDM